MGIEPAALPDLLRLRKTVPVAPHDRCCQVKAGLR
jgi:hypothetical protein